MPRYPILPLLALLTVLSSTAPSISAVNSVSEPSSAPASDGSGVGRWQILTKHNFSSQIRLHRHILLLISLPWSGEVRSLMREISEMTRVDKDGLGGLKLMYMHRNKEKMLAEAIEGGDGGRVVSVVYYRDSLPYKYRGGALRAKSILFSVLPFVSGGSGEEVGVPVKRIGSREEVEEFLGSTDKGLVLVEVCGWTGKLLEAGGSGGRMNGSEGGIGLQGLSEVASKKSLSRRKEYTKGMDSDNFQCGVERGFNGIPWLGEFSTMNDSTPLQDNDSQVIKNVKSGGGLSCALEEFQQFDAFFPKFMSVARDFFLPTERHRFGLITEKSLVSSLGIADSRSWFVMLCINGCPTCSKILEEGDDLKSVLQNTQTIVTELEGDGQELDLVLPANKQSILLFVDRLSSSPQSREKSWEALNAFRELALHYKISNQERQRDDDKSEGSPVLHSQNQQTNFGHPRLKFSPASPKIKVQDKVSIMIVNEDKYTSLDDIASRMPGSSLHEILTRLLQTDVTKLSSVAKEAGFQLLSDDLDIKPSDAMPSETQLESKQGSPVPSLSSGVVGYATSAEDGRSKTDNLPSSEVDVDSTIQIATTSDVEVSEHGLPFENSLPSSGVDVESTVQIASTSDLEVSELGLPFEHNMPSSEVDVDSTTGIAATGDVEASEHGLPFERNLQAEEKSFSQPDMLGEEYLQGQNFRGSFFFFDGNYQFLRVLTSETKIPSMVIVDPILQQHYIFPAQANFSFSSMNTFLGEYLHGSLVPYQRSESEPEKPRKSTSPPLVNLDFHEADSVPRVVAHTFSQHVLGINQSDNDNTPNAWNEDVAVLFSNSWCGFCQRMELVVREVYRAIQGFTSMLKARSMTGEAVISGDNMKISVQKVPKIFYMDCLLNDCSVILRSFGLREVYPSLVLFPAERKRAIYYEGNMAVADIVRFIADYGRNSQHLTREKGILWTKAERKGMRGDSREHTSATMITDDVAISKDKSHEVLLKNRKPKKVVRYSPIETHTSEGPRESTSKVVVGSILIATKKVVVQPFDNSMVLIVIADQTTGFQGLIYNKLISWDSFHELEQGLELIKQAPLSLGGPVIKRGMPLVALTRNPIEDQLPEVVPGVYFLDQSATLGEIEELKSGNKSVADYWFFLGFSSWGWDQLFAEIDEGAWNFTENSELFHWP